MGIFTSNKVVFPWKELKSVQEFQNLWNSEVPFLVFKHSTRCSISSMALRRFEHSFSTADFHELYYLDLLQYRNISNEIAEITKVYHQSPQVLVIKNKEIIYHASHEQIDAETIEKLL